MLHYHNIPLKLWAEAIHIAVYLLNRTINTQVGFTTPYELWFHTKPSVSHYRIFGIVAYIFIDKSLHTKFQAKGHKVIFVGYSDTSKGWHFWNPSTDKITESSDVIFDEHNVDLSPLHRHHPLLFLHTYISLLTFLLLLLFLYPYLQWPTSYLQWPLLIQWETL